MTTLELIRTELVNYISQCDLDHYTHKNRNGLTVYNFYDFRDRLGDPQDLEIAVILTGVLGFKSIETGGGCNRCFFSKEHLACVTWCEGDVQIVIYKDVPEYEAERLSAIEFYKEG